MKSSDRRSLILRLLENNVVETQEELLSLLKARSVETTQATVSRDVKKLNLVKSVDSQGRYRYLSVGGVGENSVESLKLLHAAVLSIDYALNNVVIRCGAGMAQAVAAALDQHRFEQVLGSVAGDDTILIVTRSSAASEELVRYLNERIGR